MTRLKTTDPVILCSINVGGNRWTTARADRVYFNRGVWLPWVGLSITRYKSGSVRYATLDGEHISNAEANRILDFAHRVYVNVKTGELVIESFMGKGGRQLPGDEITERIAAGIDKAAAVAATAASVCVTFEGADQYGRPIDELVTSAQGARLVNAIGEHLAGRFYLPAFTVELDREENVGALARRTNGREVITFTVSDA